MLMLNKKSIFVILVVSLAMLVASSVVLGSSVDFDSAKGVYVECRDAYYNSAKPYSELSIMIQEGKNEMEELEEGYEKYYLLSQMSYLLGNIAIDEENSKDAESYFTESQESILQALKYDENSSDAKRILGDTYLMLMNYKNFFYQLRHGGKLKQLPSEAIELDSENWAAYVSLGIFFTNAPKAAGGDVEEGIKNFKIALKSEDPFWRFMAYSMMGDAYATLEKIEEARIYYNKALELYPGNIWTIENLEELN